MPSFAGALRLSLRSPARQRVGMGCASHPVAGVGMKDARCCLHAGLICTVSQHWCTALQSAEGLREAAQESGSQMWSRGGARCLTCTTF